MQPRTPYLPKFIIIGQAETVRIRKEEHVAVGTTSLCADVGVLIYDDQGRMSLTHVDVMTDLGFIAKEVSEFFPDTDYKIKLIFNALMDPISLAIIKAINAQLIRLDLFHKVDAVVGADGGRKLLNRKTENGNIVIWFDADLQLLTPTSKQMGPMAICPEKDDCESLHDLRMHIRAANASLCDEANVLPTIIYDGSWTMARPILLPAVDIDLLLSDTQEHGVAFLREGLISGLISTSEVNRMVALRRPAMLAERSDLDGTLAVLRQCEYSAAKRGLLAFYEQYCSRMRMDEFIQMLHQGVDRKALKTGSVANDSGLEERHAESSAKEQGSCEQTTRTVTSAPASTLHRAASSAAAPAPGSASSVAEPALGSEENDDDEVSVTSERSSLSID